MACHSKEEMVVGVATQVFLRYGFKRTTMGDLADAAQMSRPALYLVFPSKEEVFAAVMSRLLSASLDEIQAGMAGLTSPREKLTFAFDVWCVRPFEVMLSSPDAKDLFESSYQFATEVMNRSTSRFVGVVASVLDPFARGRTKAGLSPAQLARMLVSAVPGFKTVAKTKDEFRDLISGMISMCLASLPAAGERAPLRKKKDR